ncbi:hypothetical protein BLNAU_14939 [Blattamonas nauphoetae]|uniref:Uncharacterized protein n=1 Tax=Blattamonas nauphoetae TaxID=2049346 RepID=A0ABQ9XC95_9EUKA|nr:hypothetical protein BLNAU_14939 [Blattamonas nauphoetae]
MKLQPALDASLEAKAVKFLESVVKKDFYSSEAFLRSFASPSDISLTNFVQHLGVLISYANRAIAKVTMEIVDSLINRCSIANRLALIKANLIPEIINTLNPQSLSFAEAVDIHINVMKSITNFVWLATPDGLANNRIKHSDESQTINETILKQVLEPSKKYIWHLCVNRFSIIAGDQSNNFLTLLARILKMSPFYQPTMDLPASAPADEARCHFLSLSLPTPQLMSGCPFTLHQITSQLTRGKDEIAVGSTQLKQNRPTQQRADRQNTDTADIALYLPHRLNSHCKTTKADVSESLFLTDRFNGIARTVHMTKRETDGNG